MASAASSAACARSASARGGGQACRAGRAGEVERRDAEQLLAVGHAQRVDGRRPRPGRVTAADEQLGALLHRAAGRRLGDGAPVLRVGARGGRPAPPRRRAPRARARAPRPGRPAPAVTGSAQRSGRRHDRLHEPHERQQGAGRGPARRPAPRRARRSSMCSRERTRQRRAGSASRRVARAPGRRTPAARWRPGWIRDRGSSRRRRSQAREVALELEGVTWCGSPPTPRACCAGRSRRRARRGSRRRARCSSMTGSPR